MVRMSSLFALVVVLSSSLAYGQSMPGGLHGVTRTDNGLPLPGVQVVVRRMDENTERSVVSNDHGAFLVENLKTGRYHLTASKAGFGSSSVTTVELVAQQSLLVDMTLATANGPKGSTDPARTADTHGQLLTENTGRESLAEQIRQLRDQFNQLGQRLAVLEAEEAKGATQAPIPTQPAPVAAPDKGLTQAAAPATRVLVASLDGTAGLKPAAKPQALSLTPHLGTPVAATSSGASLAGETPASPPQEASPRQKEEDRSLFGLGLDLAQRQPPHQGYLLGHEILYARDPS